MDFLDNFNSLKVPVLDDQIQFSAIPISGFECHRIAKDRNGNPSLLLSVDPFSDTILVPDLKLKNLSVSYNVNCIIHQRGDILEKTFSVLSYVGKDQNLINYFLKLGSTLICELGISPSQNAIQIEVSKFVELFRLAIEPEKKTIQGLWAELFIIAQSRNPVLMLQCWHVTPDDIFDFNAGEERIEVKSTSLNQRVHTFSTEQLNPPEATKTIIASLFVKQSSFGKSIESLKNDIQDKLSGYHDLNEKLNYQIATSLGNSIHEISKFKFDFEFSKTSLRFFEVENVPKISQDLIPPLVFDVKFKSDLSLIEPITPNVLYKDSFLFSAL